MINSSAIAGLLSIRVFSSPPLGLGLSRWSGRKQHTLATLYIKRFRTGYTADGTEPFRDIGCPGELPPPACDREHVESNASAANCELEGISRPEPCGPH